MLFHMLIAIMILITTSFSGPVSHNGFSEIDSITSAIGRDTVTMVYGNRWFERGGAEDITVLVKVNDTSATGYANDSIKFILGINLGMITTDTTTSKKRIDTAKSIYIDIDTINIANAGTKRTWALLNAGLTYTGNMFDTLDVRGFATQIIPLTGSRLMPSWTHLYRYYAKGMDKNKATVPLKLYIQNCRKLFIIVHEQ